MSCIARNSEAQGQIRVVLKQHLDELQIKNPSYSLRAFAKKLQMSPSTISEILSGKRPVTNNLYDRICDALIIDPQTRKNLIENTVGQDSEELDTFQYEQINMDQYHLIGEWYYFAILSLADTDDFVGEVEFVSKRLGLSKNITAEALQRLERLDLLVRDSNGNLTATGKQFNTSTDIANHSLRKHHHQNLTLASESLEQDKIDKRDFSFINMAIDPADIPSMKKDIQNFRRSFCKKYEKNQKKEVYKMCIQLFPQSKQENV